MKTVLFVCVENSNGSQMAQFFHGTAVDVAVRNVIQKNVLALRVSVEVSC